MQWTFHVVIKKSLLVFQLWISPLQNQVHAKFGPQAASSLHFHGQQYKEFLHHKVTLFWTSEWTSHLGKIRQGEATHSKVCVNMHARAISAFLQHPMKPVCLPHKLHLPLFFIQSTTYFIYYYYYYYYYSHKGTLSLVKVTDVRERRDTMRAGITVMLHTLHALKNHKKFFLKRLLLTMNEKLKIRTHNDLFALYFFIFNTYFIWQVNT